MGYGRGGRATGSAIPAYVPARFRDPLRRAAQRFSVSAALLAAQIQAESNFNPYARSPAGARGIAQFMPATARSYGLGDPFDPEAAIGAQARLMRDLPAPLRLGAPRAGRLQRGPGARAALRLHPALSRDARLRRAHPGPARGRRRRGG